MQYINDKKYLLPINRVKDRVYIDIESNLERTPVEVTVINYSGEIICNQIIKPHDNFFNKINQKSHVGLTDKVLINDSKLTWLEMETILKNMFKPYIVVAWNLDFEQDFFSDRLDSAFAVQCEMKRFAFYYKDYNPYFNDYNWKSLKFAAQHFGIEVNGSHHRSYTDAEILRKISLRLDEELFHRRLGMQNPTYNIKVENNTFIENKFDG